MKNYSKLWTIATCLTLTAGLGNAECLADDISILASGSISPTGWMTVEAEDISRVLGTSSGGEVTAKWLRVSIETNTKSYQAVFPGGAFQTPSHSQIDWDCYQLFASAPLDRSRTSDNRVRLRAFGYGSARITQTGTPTFPVFQSLLDCSVKVE